MPYVPTLSSSASQTDCCCGMRTHEASHSEQWQRPSTGSDNKVVACLLLQPMSLLHKACLLHFAVRIWGLRDIESISRRGGGGRSWALWGGPLNGTAHCNLYPSMPIAEGIEYPALPFSLKILESRVAWWMLRGPNGKLLQPSAQILCSIGSSKVLAGAGSSQALFVCRVATRD